MRFEELEVSLYFFGGDPIPYIGLVPIDPRSSVAIWTVFGLPEECIIGTLNYPGTIIEYSKFWVRVRTPLSECVTTLLLN